MDKLDSIENREMLSTSPGVTSSFLLFSDFSVDKIEVVDRDVPEECIHEQSGKGLVANDPTSRVLHFSDRNKDR